MARSLSAGMVTEITAESLRPFIAVEIEFEEGTTRAWSGYGSVTIEGEEYFGVGTFASIGAINESTENKAVGVQLRLSGIPPELIATALSENYQGNPCTIYLGALTDEHEVIASPYVLFKGQIDAMNISEDSESATITLTAENRMIDLERARVRRYTSEDQKIDFPNDKGLEYVPSIQEYEVLWGING
jgi:hypothetical protein